MRDAMISFTTPPPLMPLFQVAALCYRLKAGKLEILLITSRGTGRWVVPKGWPIAGLDGPGAARQEAWEEAGVKRGRVETQPLGQFSYFKRTENDAVLHVQVLLYPLRVEKLAQSFPERDARRRRWISPGRAAKMVQEPDLAAMLQQFRPQFRPRSGL